MLSVIGEALIDVVRRGDETPERCPGGSPMNVALGAARMGHAVRFLGMWGEDPDGRMIEGHLRAEGIQLPVPATSAPTSVAEATIAPSGSADYAFRVNWDFPLDQQQLDDLVADSALLHVGSIACVLEPGDAQVLAAVEHARDRALISFDPNVRPTITPDAQAVREKVERFVSQAHVIKASDEDLLWLYPGRTLQESARQWLRAGASLVVVTRGELGPWAINDAVGQAGVEAPAVVTEVADTVGAGDTFMASLLSQFADRGLTGADAAGAIAQLDQEELESILHVASAAAALTVSRSGADLPTRDELDAALGEHGKPSQVIAARDS